MLLGKVLTAGDGVDITTRHPSLRSSRRVCVARGVAMSQRMLVFTAVALGTQLCTVSAQQQFPYVAITPGRNTCFEILELERLRINPQTLNLLVYPGDEALAQDYNRIISWLQGF